MTVGEPYQFCLPFQHEHKSGGSNVGIAAQNVLRVLGRCGMDQLYEAVGAAIALISGETDQVFQDLGRDGALAAAEKIAVERAITAGADPSSIRVVDVEDTPIAYLPGDARRVRVRVVGELLLSQSF